MSWVVNLYLFISQLNAGEMKDLETHEFAALKTVLLKKFKTINTKAYHLLLNKWLIHILLLLLVFSLSLSSYKK